MRLILLLLAGALCLVLATACGDDDDATQTPTASPTSSASAASPTSTATGPAVTAAPTGPRAPADVLLLPVSTLKAPLTETYQTGQAGPPSPGQLPVSAKVDAVWYQSLGRYVVYYAGLSLEASGPLCPGNSIRTESGFEHVSNAPTEEGACTGAPALAADPAGVKICDGKVLYLTEIPVEAQGTLYGSIEVYLEDGSIVGEKGQTEANAADAPVIDLTPCSDAVS